jgi:tRNA 2-selenouridine synthase
MPAAEVLRLLNTFDTIIDARSEGEFDEDHLPGAANWPTLNNEERILIGTLYKQVNQFEAKKRGAALAARNIASHIEREVIEKPRDWKPLTYCWRGGKRSGSLSLILDQIGFRVTLVEGGYKAFRAAMLLDIPLQAERLHFRVVCGTTGSGKTRLLHALAAQGAQVLDLEGLANHRSSVLDPQRPVYVESESKKVGNVAIPTALVERMRASPCLDLTLPLSERVALLMEDYAFFVKDQAHFCERLDALTSIRGKVVIEAWKEQVQRGAVENVVQELLTLHYDPVYLQSMRRNFAQYAHATAITAQSRSIQAMAKLAGELLQSR